MASAVGPGRRGETALRQISSEALEESKPLPDGGTGRVFICRWLRSKMNRKLPVRIVLSAFSIHNVILIQKKI